ncbi:MAG TPA: AarF/ABC1/UbiB kinase family protein, partial [Thermoanaerobaculia bacterium]|nr:AarF/ABC1/UbiB kinase family protein [Thermoanaerobaculia bacterium]
MTRAGIDFRRYRKARRFVIRIFLHVFWWDVILNVPGLRRFRRPATARWQEIARRYRTLASEMGGVLIKLGQFFSTRVDILPPE